MVIQMEINTCKQNLSLLATGSTQDVACYITIILYGEQLHNSYIQAMATYN